MPNPFLLNKIRQYTSAKEKFLKELSFELENSSMIKIRDSILSLGTILEEDFDTSTYVLSVPSGIGNRNTAIVVIRLSGNAVSMMAYANEGLINQNTANKAINTIYKSITKCT